MLLDEINNTSKAITKTFSPYNTYGNEEKKAAMEVIESGVLSKFIGAWCEDFYGGPKVLAFEQNWKHYFKVEHAVSVNSATSGLIVALGAIDLEPQDEVIVSPWTMSATATAILVWNAIPVFVDIEERTFGLDPEKIKQKITPRTKAIIVTDIFGHAAELNKILEIAKAHNLVVIEDAAQAPGALYHDKYVGTVGDIGIFSLNYHKHIHTGEGGVCVTNNPVYAERMQLLRNHAESVVGRKGVDNIQNMVGFNFRLGEIEAALGIEQLKKLPKILALRTPLVKLLLDELRDLPGLKLPFIDKNCSHVYYLIPFVIDRKVTTIPRSEIIHALEKQGMQGLAQGYTNVHLLPMYQKKIAYGKQHYPWQESKISYEKGICPTAERLHQEDYFSFLFSMFELDSHDMKLIAKAFYQAWKSLGII